eukprot:gene14349-16969_t
MAPYSVSHLLMAFFSAILACSVCLVAGSPNTKEIAPGVFMPFVNLGGVESRPSNYTLWLGEGGRGLDTALTYGAKVQQEVGKAMDQAMDWHGGMPRSEIFLTTKIPCCPAGAGIPGCEGHNSSVVQDIQADFDQLGQPYVDLMLLHWPCEKLEDTVAAYKALESLVSSKKARAIGVSNFNSTMIDALMQQVSVKPAVNQCGFSIGGHNTSAYGMDYETLKRCRELGITYSAYSPLGGLSHIDVLSDPDVVQIAKKHNKSPAQVALRWVVQQEVVAVTASTQMKYDDQDLDIFNFQLTEDEMILLAVK